MVSITPDTRIKEIMAIPELRPVSKYLVAGKGLVRTIVVNLKIKHLCIDTPIVDTTSIESKSIIRGLNRLLEVSKNKYFFAPLYSKAECRKDMTRKDVNLVHFPAKSRKNDKPFVVVSAGGAYNNVFSIAEAYPVATRLNELGYSVFILTYSVGGKGIFPKPLDDLAKALAHIKKHRGKYRINHFTYVLFGFSAGGNLSALWGTDKHGYKAYGLAKPHALVLVYPVISIRLFSSKKIADILTKTMLGVSSKKAKDMEYNVDELVTKSYPPTYIVCCKDDNVVPTVNSMSLKKRLGELAIPSYIEVGQGGGHGFGEGIATSVEGWIERADEFISKL